MRQFSSVLVDRVLEYLQAHGQVPTRSLSGFKIFPVSFERRRDFTVFFTSRKIDKSDYSHLKNCIVLGGEPNILLGDETLCYVPCRDPRMQFFDLIENLFLMRRLDLNMDPSAKIDSSSLIGRDVIVGSNVVIGANCRIGDRTEIRSNVVIHDNVSIGVDCLIKSGSVIGQEGFGIYEPDGGKPTLIPHLGGVHIGDRVLIGALNTICSGTLDPSSIGNDTKLDDHVHIAHNCIIGKNVIITACAEVSGSVRIEDGVWVGPSAAIINKITIGEGSLIGLGSVVIKDVAPNKVVAGNPARVIRDRR